MRAFIEKPNKDINEGPALTQVLKLKVQQLHKTQMHMSTASPVLSSVRAHLCAAWN